MSRAQNCDPSHLCLVFVPSCIFLWSPVSMPESNWHTLNIFCRPTRQPAPSSLAWLNPVCQSAVLLCALHAPVLCLLVTGYLGFTHCCWRLSLHLQPFMAVKGSLSSPLYIFSTFLPLLTLQLSSFQHPHAAPSHPAIQAANPILLKTVIEHYHMLGLGRLVGVLSLQKKFGLNHG